MRVAYQGLVFRKVTHCVHRGLKFRWRSIDASLIESFVAQHRFRCNHQSLFQWLQLHRDGSRLFQSNLGMCHHLSPRWNLTMSHDSYRHWKSWSSSFYFGILFNTSVWSPSVIRLCYSLSKYCSADCFFEFGKSFSKSRRTVVYHRPFQEQHCQSDRWTCEDHVGSDQIDACH